MIPIPQNIFTHVPNAIPIKILLAFEEKINIKLAIIKQLSSNGFSNIIKILPFPVGHGKEMRHHVEPARSLRGLPDGNADRSCFPPNHSGKIIHVLPICRFPTLVVIVCFLLVPASSSLPPEIPHVWGLLYIGDCLTNILKFKGNAMLNNQSIRDQIRVVTGPGAEATIVEEIGRAMAFPHLINSIQFIINSLSFIERGLNDLRVGYECQHHQNRHSHLPEQSSITRHRIVFVLYQVRYQSQFSS